MMGKIHKPADKEKFFQTLLVSLDPLKELHIWFEITNHRYPREMDCLIYCNAIGLFGLELKGYPIQDLIEINGDYLKTTKRTERPWIQANDATKSISNALNDTIQRKLFVFPCVVFWQIARGQFKKAFQGSLTDNNRDRFMQQLNATIFKDDLVSLSQFRQKLREIAQKPFLAVSPLTKSKRASSEGEELSKNEIRAITDKFAPHWIAQIESPYDRKRIEKLEQSIIEVVKKKLVPEKLYVCTGKVGTGKTFMGLAHAINTFQHGKKVLFLCFNRTLATDIRRLLWVGRIYKEKDDEHMLQVKDFYQLATEQLPHDYDVRKADDNANDYTALNRIGQDLALALQYPDEKQMQNDVITALEAYDLIVVDEAQDLEEWMLEIVNSYSDKFKKLFIIYGEDQLIYRPKPHPWLEEITSLPNKTSINLRRVFRNTGTNFWIAQLFLEGARGKTYDIERAQQFYIKHYLKLHQLQNWKAKDKPEMASIEIEREGGRPPILHALKVSNYNIVAISDRFKQVIERVFETTTKLGGKPCDNIVMVPPPAFLDISMLNFSWYDFAQAVFKSMGMQYQDYVKSDSKREFFANDEIRLCTYQNARGLEAYNTVLLGFHNIMKVDVINGRNDYLAYIALSRALFDTHIVYFDLELGTAPMNYRKKDNTELSNPEGDRSSVLFDGAKRPRQGTTAQFRIHGSEATLTNGFWDKVGDEEITFLDDSKDEPPAWDDHGKDTCLNNSGVMAYLRSIADIVCG